MRAVAVLLVMVYHAGLPFLPHGYLGVDVFFVISGYLITSLLLRELAATGHISWPQFLARRARRLLPAAMLVLVFIATTTWLLIPGRRGREIGGDIVGAALYVVNWVLAGRSVDYLAKDTQPSPVQHYWSLAVEEQFYVIWPLCLVLLVFVLRRFRPRVLARGPGHSPSLRAIGILLAAIAVPSLAYSVWHTITVPAHAYFATTTRVWELGVGAALAIWAVDQHPHRVRFGGVLGWVGLAVVVGTAFLLPDTAGWPGAWALLPTLGTAAVILSGWGEGSQGPGRLLSLRPLVWVGGLSYSLYLWHWPLRVFADELWPGGTARAWAVLLSVVPAYLGYRLVERPVHHTPRLARSTRRSLTLGAALSLVGVLAGIPLITAPAVFETKPPTGALPPLEQLGAGTLGETPSADPAAYAVDDWGWLTPDPERAGEDRPSADVDRCQVDERTSTPVRCEFGVKDGPLTIALVGDSKALQWLPALERAAPGQGWRIITYGKSSCAFAAGTTELSRAHYQSCDDWNEAVIRQLVADPPDLVVTSTQADAALRGDKVSRSALVDYLARRWKGLQRAGVPVAVIGDNPGSPSDLDSCMARNPRHLTRCAFDRETALANTGLDAQRAAALKAPGVELIDLTPWICPVERCPVAIGHVVIHRAGDHITATYAATLGPQIARQLEAVMTRERR
ncbi:acyltransferase family protein [Phycicoccus sp. SLBN-51]|uniref:acyltransferase family protein n=1 Tax=Phycicoccus sp. SLBN-51 TaxID=2768447 RepID=UPI00336A66D4